MGKIIVHNIKGMGLKAKIGLIVMFTFAFSVLLYQGWNQLRSADAAITMAGWTTLYNSATTYPNAASVAYTLPAGNNRMLVVMVTSARSAVGSHTYTVSYNGTAMTRANGDNTTTTVRQHSAIYYLPMGTSASSSSANFALTVSGGTCNGVVIYANTLTNVDQAGTPVSQIKTATTATTTTPVFSTALSSAANDQALAIMNVFRSGSTTAYTTTAVTNWTRPTAGLAGNVTSTGATTTTGVIRATAAYRAIPTTTATSTSMATVSTASLVSMTGISLKAATTTLGTGVNGATANVAPGAVNQKLGGFSFVTSSAGTTDSITALTVTTTGYLAIASARIENEAGGTQYFTTITNPASNTLTFSGGTPIPVTSTASNYKILVTYKDRASAPATNTATSAYVSAYTGSNISATGADTADTTLTCLNTHAASTWGTNTPGDGYIDLAWTKGTSAQSVIVIRYTANTDTTKPADNSTYLQNSVFGTGGTVVYNGAGTTYRSSGLSNGTNYYYKIFEYDALNYYYNASDVWTGALKPLSADTTAPTVDAGFAATSPLNTTIIPITSFGATDNVGGNGVSGYMITLNPTQPTAGDTAWTQTPPATYTVGAAGTYTLYPWAKDSGGNVSALYGAPVQVIVDTTKPTVNTFTVASQVATKAIPISSFTASDTGDSGMAGYMITTSSSPPAYNNAGWTSTAPATYPVASDGSYTLYPWAKDAATNVSVVGTPQTVLVDSTAPTGLTLVSPADNAVALPLTTTLSCSTATDGTGVGGIQYQFAITDESSYNVNSGWQTGTTYAPAALVKGVRYLWSVKAKDALGTETAWLTQRNFTITAPCVRNNPTPIVLNAGGGVASTIPTDSGTASYNVRLMNNDTGDCGSTTFNLSLTDTDLYDSFDDTVFDNGQVTKSITLPTNSETTTPITVKSMPGEDSGIQKTIVTIAADPAATHDKIDSGFVQTTLNVVTCQPQIPLIVVGPNSGYLNRSGSMVYTITVKNTDTGAQCTPVTYTFARSDDNLASFNVSQYSAPTLTLNASELGSATLTVSAKATAPLNAVNLTSISISAANHEAPPAITVKSTVNNPMLHNSDSVASPKWTVSGGWGIPNGRYGEIKCETCHVGGGGDTTNIKRVNEKIFTPYTSFGAPKFPGHGKTVAYRRYSGSSPNSSVLGWDSNGTPRTTSFKVCESCHTYDATKANGVMAHPYSTAGATLGNHFKTDGKDCTRCHKHNKGFGAANLACTGCHGNHAITTITADNRYYVAPPESVDEHAGIATGTGQVSNDPKVGAHQTHLLFFNGFSNYSTVDFRCASCHGPVPVGFAHADGNSSPTSKFQGLAVKGGATPAFNSTNLTCSNTYCHNPAATTVLKYATNKGTKVFPSWTSAKLLGDTKKTQENCGVCHKSPGDAGFEPAGTHNNMTIANRTCIGCHGHEGDTQGVAGKRHMDGKLYGAGACNTCHGYYAASWGLPETLVINTGGAGAHAAHITYLTTKLNNVTLNFETDQYAGPADSWTLVCGVCHDNTAGKHLDNVVDVKFNQNYFYGTTGTALFNGIPGGAGAKSCSNLSCHYFTTPLWSN